MISLSQKIQIHKSSTTTAGAISTGISAAPYSSTRNPANNNKIHMLDKNGVLTLAECQKKSNRTKDDCDADNVEYEARDLANVAWVNRAFDTAASDLTVKGIVIMNQANVFERFLEPGQGYGRSGYENFVNTLRIRTMAFGKREGVAL